MPAEWQINYWPQCVAHIFLSHSAEDRINLVIPVYQELERRGISPWIDRHHYPIGRDAFEALREELLKCRHIVYFITPSLLLQGRGWTSVERAFATTIQKQLSYGQEIAHVELPLFFVKPDDKIFQRSIWHPLCNKGTYYPNISSQPSWQYGHVQWAVDAIEKFIREEEKWSLELGARFGQDSRLSNHFQDLNLRKRLLAQSPIPLGII